MNPKDLLLQSSKAWPALTYDIHVQKQSQKRAPAIQDDPHRIREKLRGDEQAYMDAVEHEHLECPSASVDRETRLSHQSLEDPDFESMHKRLMVELYGETPTQESEDNDVADMLLDIHVARDISASSNYVAADTETPESKYLTIWRAEAVASVRALQNRIDSLQTIVDGTHILGHNGNMSLMHVPGDMNHVHKRVAGMSTTFHSHVTLVHWSDAERRMGVPVRIDKANRHVFSVSGVIEKRSFADSATVHPDVGHSMLNILRVKLPDHVLRLKKMWCVALSYRDLHPPPLPRPCALCDEADESVERCFFCLCCCHDSCLTAVAQSGTPSLDAVIGADAVPSLFAEAAEHSGLCALCQQVLPLPGLPNKKKVYNI